MKCVCSLQCPHATVTPQNKACPDKAESAYTQGGEPFFLHEPAEEVKLVVAFPGSAVAFGKLHGVLASKPLALPGKNAINIGLAAGNAAAAATFLTTGDPATAVAALGATTVLGGIQGAHMTASIGGMIHTFHLSF